MTGVAGSDGGESGGGGCYRGTEGQVWPGDEGWGEGRSSVALSMGSGVSLRYRVGTTLDWRVLDLDCHHGPLGDREREAAHCQHDVG